MGFGLEPLKGKDLSSLKILGTVGEPSMKKHGIGMMKISVRKNAR